MEIQGPCLNVMLPLSAGQVEAASGAQGTVGPFYSLSSKAHHGVRGTLKTI